MAAITLPAVSSASSRRSRHTSAMASQHAADARPSIPLLARNVGAAKIGSAVGSEEGGQRPSALPADGRDRGLIARVHIGPLVAIHLDRDKMLVDDRGDLGVLIGLAVHHVAPVAPDRANVQQDRLVLRLGAGKRLLAPGVPLYRLMPGGTQVG